MRPSLKGEKNGGYPRGLICLETIRPGDTMTERLLVNNDQWAAVVGRPGGGSTLYLRSGHTVDIIEAPGVFAARMEESEA